MSIQITMALVGFQGRGGTDGVQRDFCHALFLETLDTRMVGILGESGPYNGVREGVKRVRETGTD